jgi:ABC-type Zn uptake system ZnuABC Zn-binding protein ZnuA
MTERYNRLWLVLLVLAGGVVVMAGCNAAQTPGDTAVPPTTLAPLTLPTLDAVELNGRPLKVVASTSIIGDVVAQVGGEAIDLTTLIEPGQDPHSYNPGAQELTAVADADVIFVNGWDLEESLARNLKTIGDAAPVVPISANIKPLPFGDGDSANPHVWFSVQNAMQWVKNTEQVLSELDPAHSDAYAANAAAYLAELDDLQTYVENTLSAIPAEKRFLVTNHDAFGYFAEAYGFEILGAVIPGMSTLAEPSANDLSRLIEIMKEHGTCTIFTETTVSDTLAQTVATELDSCDGVQVVKLYTGSIGPTGSGADSYIGMIRANTEAIADGLQR